MLDYGFEEKSNVNRTGSFAALRMTFSRQRVCCYSQFSMMFSKSCWQRAPTPRIEAAAGFTDLPVKPYFGWRPTEAPAKKC